MGSTYRGSRAALSLLVCVAALASMAFPSSAATTNITWDISGHIAVHWGGGTHLINDPLGPMICVPASTGSPTILFHVNDATGATHVNGASAYGGFDPMDINIAGTNYQMQISGASGTTTGSINPWTNTFSHAVAFTFSIKNCAGTATLCTFTVVFPLSGHTYTGGAIPATGDTVTMSGSGASPINPAIGCTAAIRPTILGSTVSGTYHFTAH